MIESLDWVRYTRWTLWFTGVVYLVLGVLLGAAFPAGLLAEDAEESEFLEGFGALLGAVSFVLCGGFAAVNFGAAWGLSQGRRWAWILGVIIGGIYASSACLPFGALVLYGLLNDRVRKVFL